MPLIETIIFGGGCFWCLEAIFQMLRGVESVSSGYTGGTHATASYEEVSSGATGHAESIEVKYDPTVIKLEDLLAVFFTSHDPTSLNRQGNDVGSQYRSAIFFTTPEQKEIIDNFIVELTTSQTFIKPIVTEVSKLETFFPAEEYHQNYYRDNADQPYCQAVINPKIAKLREKYARFLKDESQQ